MDGFNLFQDKIKGEVNYPRANDAALFFFEQDQTLSDEFFDLMDSSTGALYYQSLDSKGVFADEIYFDFEPESTMNIDFRLDYSSENNSTSLEDYRHVMFNYNNDIAPEGRKNMIMFFD